MRLAKAIIIIISCCCFFSYQRFDNDDNAAMFDDWFLQQLQILKAETQRFDSLLINQHSNQLLKTQFQKMRLAYKKLSVLTDYFNSYETIQLNSPALERTEEDHPTNIIAPHGFQQLEELIWNNAATEERKKKLQQEIQYLLQVYSRLEQEPDRIYQFKKERVWDAMRTAIITITCKGITGFDSPVAQYALPETRAMLSAIAELQEIYKTGEGKKYTQLIDILGIGIENAKNFLQANNDFNQFNRLVFIKDYLNPISQQLMEAGNDMGFNLPAERRPLAVSAKNIFEPGAFDVNFFSPNSNYQLTAERILLGKKLFYETKLSINNKRSCASCHQPANAFTDGLKTASGIDSARSLQRNTPTLFNAVFQTKQFYDSRRTMLEFQVSSVVHNENEMGGSLEKAAQVLSKDKAYQQAFKQAYPLDKDPVSVFSIANAIASYVRSLQSLNARFDQYMRNEPVVLTKREMNGFNLFMGKAKCATCHFIPLFNGLVPPKFNETESEVLGIPSNTGKNPENDADSGKYYFTRSPVHLYAFKTPTLRNIALTAPYMHNGVYKTLEEVMEFYNNGGGKGLGIDLPNQSLPFDKLELSKKEKKDIIAFMQTLTDTGYYKKLSY